jgi:hypothetical protein
MERKRVFQRVKRWLSTAISATMIFTSFPWTVFAEENADTQAVVANLPKTREEVKDLRNEISKVYKNPDGTYTAEVMSDPIHYKNGSQWDDIDNELVESSDGNNFENKKNKFKVKFNKSVSSENKRLLTYNIDKHNVDFEVYKEPKSVNVAKLNVNNNKIEYQDLYDGVSYEYKLDSSKVKENIILNSYPGTNTFKFLIKTNSLTAKKMDNGIINFYDKSTNNFVFYIQKPYMFDSREGNESNISQDIHQEISETSNGYILTITADDSYLKSQDRVYPVTIDPWIDTFPTIDTFVASKDSNSTFHYNDHSLYAGYDTNLGHTRTYLKWNSDILPYVPDADVVSAKLGLRQYSPTTTTSIEHNVYRVTKDFNPNEVTYATQPTYDASPIDYKVTVPGKYTYFDLSNIIQDWYNYPNSNYGVLIKYTTQVENTFEPKKLFYSSEYTPSSSDVYTKPKLVINYRPTHGGYGFTDYWTYTPELLNGIGEGKVNVMNGNLVYNFDLFNAPSRTGAFNLKLTYNSQSIYNNAINDNEIYGKGNLGYRWVLNAGRKIIINSDGKVIRYIDDTGTRYDFNKHQEDSLSTYSAPSGTFFSMDVISGQYIITYPDQTKYYFDSAGRNIKITYENGSVVTYTYDGDSSRILKISERYGTETTGKDLSLIYDPNNGRLSKIIDPKGTETLLNYSFIDLVQGYSLDSITKASNRDKPNITKFEYNSEQQLSSITDGNQNKSKIEYDTSNRVTKVIDPRSDSIYYQINYTEAGPDEENYYSGLIKSTLFTDLNNVKTNYINSVDPQYLTVNTSEITTDFETNNASTTKYTWSGNSIVAVYEPDPLTGKPKTTPSETNEYSLSSGTLIKNTSSIGDININYYDASNNLTSNNYNGSITNNTYDNNSNLISTKDPLLITDYNKYDRFGNSIKSFNGTSDSFNKALNSSFEYVDTNSFPVNWFRRSAGGTYTIDKTNKIFGNNSIKISGVFDTLKVVHLFD